MPRRGERRGRFAIHAGHDVVRDEHAVGPGIYAGFKRQERAVLKRRKVAVVVHDARVAVRRIAVAGEML